MTVSHPFFHAFYYVLGIVFQKIVAASHPFFSREIICYERQKDIAFVLDTCGALERQSKASVILTFEMCF